MGRGHGPLRAPSPDPSPSGRGTPGGGLQLSIAPALLSDTVLATVITVGVRAQLYKKLISRLHYMSVCCAYSHKRRHGIKCGYAECEAGRADARGRKGQKRGRASWGGGSEPPPHQLGSLGERCKLPSRIRGGSPETFEFGALGDLKIASKQCKMMFFVN